MELIHLDQTARGVHPVVSGEVLDRLLLIDDFRINLHPTPRFGLHLEFWSVALGYLTQFPWQDHVQEHLARRPAPWVGTPDDPYSDLDQGWEIFIWCEAGDVVVIAGDFESPPGSFYAAFRVPEETFDREWTSLILAVEEMRAGGRKGPLRKSLVERARRRFTRGGY
jgi:hypothetical protein